MYTDLDQPDFASSALGGNFATVAKLENGDNDNNIIDVDKFAVSSLAGHDWYNPPLNDTAEFEQNGGGGGFEEFGEDTSHPSRYDQQPLSQIRLSQATSLPAAPDQSRVRIPAQNTSGKDLLPRVNYLRQQSKSSAVVDSGSSHSPQSPYLSLDDNAGTPSLSQTNQQSIRKLQASHALRSRDEFRPKTSIPSHLQLEEYAEQCVLAAYSSRLNPFALHPEEHQLFRQHITHAQITNYLNIRNGILRLWTRNPLVSVTREEAAGCTRDYRWFNVADVCLQWLIRRGYINFGCAEVPAVTAMPGTPSNSLEDPKRETVVVIGAGMSGLGCARQLEGLFNQFQDRWTSQGQEIPRVVVIEGRGRIGGRVYSHPFRTQAPENLPNGLRSTADMGAQIITGFDHGNPLNAIIRGQLALHTHTLKDNSILYDSDGTPVDKDRDQMVEKLYNDILDRASLYRHRIPTPVAIEGDKELIESGKDAPSEGGKLISVLEDAAAPLPLPGTGHMSTRCGSVEPETVPTGVDRLTGKANVVPGMPSKLPAAELVRTLGWDLKDGVRSDRSLHLDSVAHRTENPRLGPVMDEAVAQFQGIIELTGQDLRLLNWHFANLEYANAANVSDLSLGGWDQDIGNEFEGEHAEVVGGYMQVPRGLWQCPTKLDVRTRKAVKAIHYSDGASASTPATAAAAKVVCEDGEVIEASRVISTVPLGVLKANSIRFEPPLPDWKAGCIDRLGFGLLNKIVLVYETPFWDVDRDMFGILRDPAVPGSLRQSDFVSHRGLFYLFWNCIKTSGRPMLLALMAGDAAYQTEAREDGDLVTEATEVLSKMFPPPTRVPEPSEVIVSRWAKDRFARGTYSYVGHRARPDDYDEMSKPVGNLYFAGEATCGTHPATVHGAYLSGLRAASEVLESFLGPIEISGPLVTSKYHMEPPPRMADIQRNTEDSAAQKAQDFEEARLLGYEAELNMAVHERFGERPSKPGKSGANPFLLFQKDHWHACKDKCDEARRNASRNGETKATRNEVRAALGQMWREAPQEVRQPYIDLTDSNKQSNSASAAEFKERMEKWERDVEAFRADYRARNPCLPGSEERRHEVASQTVSANSTPRARKKKRKLDEDDISADS
ncbi:MAG: hypothetical protein M1825_002906 [Sarcosagium campestre]|nr:MAG: hypothetical protein M1825_002906 [Sarcosagium campestre]